MKHFRNVKSFENHLKKCKCASEDFIKINNVVYTKDYYDWMGRTITYGNKRTKTGLIVTTENRYRNGYEEQFEDVKVEFVEEAVLLDGIMGEGIYYD